MNPYVRAFEIVRYCYGSPDAFSYFAHAVEDATGPLPASVDVWGQEVELLRVFHAADSAEVRAEIKRGDESRSVPLQEISVPGASRANEAINYAYSSDEVIFADEYGNWMLSVDTSEFVSWLIQ